MALLKSYKEGGLSAVRAKLVAQQQGAEIVTEFRALSDLILPIVRDNLHLIADNLQTLGYRFGDLPDDLGYWSHLPTFAPVANMQKVEEARTLCGGLPLSIERFYTEIGGVSFLGYHPDWPAPEILDPFSFNSVDNKFLAYLRDEKVQWLDCLSDNLADYSLFPVPFAPDRYHKANISGGAPYSFLADSTDYEGKVAYFANDPIPFFDYLNLVFEWGGFPGLENAKPSEKAHVPISKIKKDTRML